jgi:hypothetical protein
MQRRKPRVLGFLCGRPGLCPGWTQVSLWQSMDSGKVFEHHDPMRYLLFFPSRLDRPQCLLTGPALRKQPEVCLFFSSPSSFGGSANSFEMYYDAQYDDLQDNHRTLLSNQRCVFSLSSAKRCENISLSSLPMGNLLRSFHSLAFEM